MASAHTVLVVEDDDNIAESMTYHLGRAGYRVLRAADGAHGLRLFRQQKPDLVILDLMLPEVDGWRFTQEIRRDDARVPLVLARARPDAPVRVGFTRETWEFELHPEVSLALDTAQYGAVTPQEWVDIAMQHDTPEADAIFLSCAATTQIDAVAPLEAASGKPVVNSNQAVLWASLERLRNKLGPFEPPPTGSLMRTLIDSKE